jgi:ATP-dependent Lhr-like helicase
VKLFSFRNNELTAEDLVAPPEAPKLQKYDEFIPNNLLRKAFASDYLNVLELRQVLSSW